MKGLRLTARDDYPVLAEMIGRERVDFRDIGREAIRALNEIDQLRREIEVCERRNEQLRRYADAACAEALRWSSFARSSRL